MASVKHYPPEGFTKRLHQAWIDSDMEITQLSNITGISRSSVYAYIIDGCVPNATALASMCKALDVSADYLLFGG